MMEKLKIVPPQIDEPFFSPYVSNFIDDNKVKSRRGYYKKIRRNR